MEHNIRVLEITIENCYKCDLETINDPNNSQYIWINRRDLEIETKRNWQVIFDKYKNLSTQKYRKELTPNITFQPNKIFVRNDLFEKIIKSCKATNLEFLKLKEKLGLCIYEEICDEKEFILMSEKKSYTAWCWKWKIKRRKWKWETRNKKRETRNEKLETRNEKVEMRNEKVETRNEKVEMRNEDKQFKKN